MSILGFFIALLIMAVYILFTYGGITGNGGDAGSEFICPVLILSGVVSFASVLIIQMKVLNNAFWFILGIWICTIVATVLLYKYKRLHLGILFSVIIISVFSFILIQVNEKGNTNYFDSSKLEEIETELNIRNVELGNLIQEIKISTDKVAKKKLNQNKKDVKKVIHEQKKMLKKGQYGLLIHTYKKIIFMIISASLFITIVVSAILIVKEIKENAVYEAYLLEEEQSRMEEEQRHIKEFAVYILESGQAFDYITNAQGYVKSYNARISKLNNEIYDAERLLKEETSQGSFLNFGHTERIENFQKRLLDAKNKENDFIAENEKIYSNSKSYLDSLGDDVDFYNKHKQEIFDEYNVLLEERKQMEAEEEQKLRERQEHEHRQALEKVAKDKKANEEQLLLKQNKDKVSRAIKELEDLIPVLQTYVSDKKKMDFQKLNAVEKKLDVLVDSKEFIADDDINNIERCQKKLSSLFNKCKNKNDFQDDIDIILDIFSKILNK